MFGRKLSGAGTDTRLRHAEVIEKARQRRTQNPHDLGREEFRQNVWGLVHTTAANAISTNLKKGWRLDLAPKHPALTWTKNAPNPVRMFLAAVGKKLHVLAAISVINLVLV
jgi:valyl-tRNA synthetase